jgi:hypothetical protein
LNIIVPIGIGIALLLALCIRRSPKPREIVQSLSPADRQFIANQIEPITKLPLDTTEDESAWLAATRAVMERLGTRFPEVASVVPEQVYHYFDDADIHRKEPSYRAASEARIREFIKLLREEPTKT